MYLEARVTCRRLNLVKVFLQTSMLWLALGICLSRISDYKHHWGDVLLGALLGACAAVGVVRSILFRMKATFIFHFCLVISQYFFFKRQ